MCLCTARTAAPVAAWLVTKPTGAATRLKPLTVASQNDAAVLAWVDLEFFADDRTLRRPWGLHERPWPHREQPPGFRQHSAL